MKGAIPPEIETTVKDFFSFDVRARLVFVFGSAVEQRFSADSDVDIGVLLEKDIESIQLHEISQAISEKLRREVDLVNLRDASPILKMQILKNGVLLLCSNPEDYSEFFTQTIKQYEDLKIIRRPIEQNILKGRIYARS
jgi:predicted nucleotidyltransferase